MKFFILLYILSICQMFSMNVLQNLMHNDQNSHLQTLNETLIQTYTYSNLWRETNVVFGGVSFHLWI